MDLYWFRQVRACSGGLIWVQTGFAKFSRREEIDYSGRKETSCIPICWIYYFFSAYNIKRAFSLFKILWSQVSTIDYCKYILYVSLLFKHVPSIYNKPKKNKFETLPYIKVNKHESFPSIFARISMFEHFRGDWADEEPNFFWEISKKIFFFQNLHFFLVLLDRFLDGFSKFWFFIGEICILILDFWVIFENYSLRMLSIRGNDFIACWAYAEPISSLAEHTRNEFPRMLSQR